MSDFDGFDDQSYLIGVLSPSWQKYILNCEKFSQLKSNLTPNIINGSLRIIPRFKNPKSWYDCGINIELPQIVGHYLRLNLSFVKPNDDFDGSFGWINDTHSMGPMKMIANNQADYVINDMFMNEIWYPNLIVTSIALKENYGISFLMKKQATRLSLANYLNVFNLFLWILIFVSILVIAFVQGTILYVKQNECRRKDKIKKSIELTLNLIFSYFNLLMCKQSSVLLAKLKPRHYLMYFIPWLSIIVVNLMTSSIYSNMISPPKQWCDSTECFVKSNYKFYALDNEPAFQLLKRKNKTEYKIIIERTQIFSERGKLIIYII